MPCDHRRAIVPAVAGVGGLASLIYGAFYHPIRVLVEKETKKTIEVPLPHRRRACP